MNSIVNAFKKFLKNKNIVTVVGVIVILSLLYFGYSTQINTAVNPVSVVVAAETIQPRTKITEDMVKTIDMPNVSVTDDVLRNKYDVVDKYSNVNTMIPEGSMFFKQSVIKEDELPDAAFIKVKKGEVIYSFRVDTESTYGNSIFPGTYVDVYMKTGDGSNEQIMIGKLLKNVEVLSVKDSSGKAVFESTSDDRTPSMMLFGLSEYNNLLMKKASYINGVELYIVPSSTASSGDKTEVSTQQLVDYINAHAIDLPADDNIDYTDPLVPTVDVKTSNNRHTVTITYPEGCGSTYTCTYTKDSERTKTVKKISQSITYNTSGTLVATVTEKNGTVHKFETKIPIETTNSTNSVNTANSTNQVTTR